MLRCCWIPFAVAAACGATGAGTTGSASGASSAQASATSSSATTSSSSSSGLTSACLIAGGTLCNLLEGRTPDEVASDMLGCTDAKGQPSLTCPPGPVGCCTPTGSEGRDEQCYYAVDAGAERGACVMFGGRWSSTP